MNILALEASTAVSSVALWQSAQVQQHSIQTPKTQSEQLLPMVQHLLRQAKVMLSECDIIAVGQGPGSFTGLRIVMAVAKALAYAHNKPLFPVCSLRALAYTAYQDHHLERVVVAIDARMGELYTATYNKEQQIVAPHLSSSDHIDVPKDYILAGNLSAYREHLMYPCYSEELYPQAEAIAILAAQEYRPDQNHTATHVQPCYIRPGVV